MAGEFEEHLRGIDRQISDFKVEGLVETAALLETIRSAIASGEPMRDNEIAAALARTVEALERRIVAVESGRS